VRSFITNLTHTQMKNYLFPHSFKKVGWVLLILSIIAAILNLPFKMEPEFLNMDPINVWGKDHEFFGTGKNLFDEIYSIGIILGSIFIAFSKEKHEDEYIQKIRLEALVWAVYFNYAVVILMIIFLYGLDFPIFLMYNLATLLIVFLIRYNWGLFQARKAISDEE